MTILLLDQATLTGSNISSALLVFSYTNTSMARKCYAAVELDGLYGIGDYVVYSTIQRGGTGSHYRVASETITAAGGVTALAVLSLPIVLNVNDLLRVYVCGQVADTSVNVTTRLWEEIGADAGAVADAVWDEARSGHTTAGTYGNTAEWAGSVDVNAIASAVWSYATRTLTSFGTLVSDIWSAANRTLTAISDSAGITTLLSRIIGTLAAGTHQPQSGDAYARLGAPTGASISADIAALPSAVDARLSFTHGSGIWGPGGGAKSVTYTVTSGGQPLAGVQCRMTTDSEGSNAVASGITNAVGQVVFQHDLATGTTVYIWRYKTGYHFDDPDIEVIP